MGWIAAEVELSTTAAGTVPVRITAVFVLDAGLWRVVQWHTSIGTPNEEVFGFELTVTLDSLLASLDEKTTETRGHLHRVFPHRLEEHLQIEPIRHHSVGTRPSRHKLQIAVNKPMTQPDHQPISPLVAPD